jgi:peptidoglycan/LPS O-acetylase OafA/YrhL
MGFYRLFLALVVAFSHWYGFPDVYPGVVAVISFFLLSGYVMTALIDKYYLRHSSVIPFYIDRMIRLYPQFLLYSVMTIIAVNFFGLRNAWLHNAPTLSNDLLQLTVLPLNFYREFPDLLMPQAWSLGLEFMFYITIPFVLIYRVRLLLALLSFCVFMIACLGYLDTDYFAYRLLPGTFFIFMLGSWIRRREENFGNKTIACILMFSSIMFVASGIISEKPVILRSIFLGIFLGVPAVYFVSKVRIFEKWDALAGNLSYGVFLNHWLILSISIQIWGLSHGFYGLFQFCCAIAVSMIASYASFRLVEEPLIQLRHQMRAKRAAIAGFDGSKVAFQDVG